MEQSGKKRKMCIRCKGMWIDGHNKCDFMHIGNWGDKELHEHEAIELSKEDGKTTFWLGYEQDTFYVKESNRGEGKNG